MRIATRVAAATVQLQGPFKTGSKPEFSTEITLPFGISGELAKLLLQSWGEDPKNLNAVQQLEKGPIPDVNIGYSILKEEYHPGSGIGYSAPDDEYELEIQLTHIEGFELSEADRNTLLKVGVEKLVYDKVFDKHAQAAANRQQENDNL